MLKLKFILFFLITFILSFFYCTSVVCQTPETEKSDSYKYLLYQPANYSKNSKIKYPLIIYLHGRSACGNNFDKVRRYGLPFFLDRGMQIDAFVAAPQCPDGKNWIAEAWFLPFLKDIKDKYHIDENRIYLTGMSLGGFGAFSIAIKYPDVFAAVVPLCGGGQPTTACPMKGIPTWIFHGDKDEQVPLKRSQEMADALERCGGSPKFTVLKGQPHDIHKTYNNPELYEWMLKQARRASYTSELAKEQDEKIENNLYLVKEEKILRKKAAREKRKNNNKKVEESEKIIVEFD